MQSAVLRSGYRHPAYARAMEEFGLPRHLPHSDGWILVRPITGTQRQDAMGCYPVFACRDWSGLELDLQEVGRDLVTLVLVADPLGDHTPGQLRRAFPDLAKPFKDHFVVELGRPLREVVHRHHQRNARKALQTVDVDQPSNPADLAAEWADLYANLISRHSISGMTAFSPRSFERQLQVPGLTMFCARHRGEIVGMALWYRQDSVGYYHLAAYSDLGYELRASFALFWRALEFFTEAGLSHLNLGAGAGLEKDRGDGLSRFKAGWATGTRTAYLCGRIFDASAYQTLTSARGNGATDYFPAYRQGEFR